MGSSVPRRLATAAMLCALVAPLWAAPPAAAQRGYDEAEIRALFDGLRNGTMPSGLAGEECRRGMAATEDAEQLAQVFSAYLDVPEEAALGATCQALVRAIKAGDVSIDTLLLFTQPVTDSGELFEDGRLPRAIFQSEERHVGKGCVRTCRSRWSPDI